MIMSKKAKELIVKTPNEKKKVNMDFAEDLETGESLSGTPTFTITPSGGSHLNIISVAVSGTKIQPFFEKGVNGTKYKVDATVDATGGQIYEGTADLLCSALG